MRTARLEYPSGREFLRDYWGYLASGGLFIAERALPTLDQLGDGDPIVLCVHIATLRKDYQLAGRVRRQRDGRALVVFDAGQPPDLLNAAWADGQGVPERRHRRFPLAGEVQFFVGGHPRSARFVNLSRGGCCLRVDEALRVGTRVAIAPQGELIDARVRWSSGPVILVGIEFDHFQEPLVEHLIGPPSRRWPQP